MSGFSAPTYTMVPNDFFDLAQEMKPAELRVLIYLMRETFGWHRSTISITIRKLARGTNLTPKSVMSASKELEAKGLVIRRVLLNNTTTWECVIESNTPCATVILQDVIPGRRELGLKKDKEIKEKEIAPSARPLDLVDAMLKYQKPVQTIRQAIHEYFRFNVNWETKTARQWMEWATGEQITPEQIQSAADMWRSDKRFNWSTPTLQKIFEQWPALMGESEYFDPLLHSERQQEIHYIGED